MLRRTVLVTFAVLVAICTVVNVGFAVNNAVTGAPLSYWDISMLSAIPTGYLLGVILLSRRYGVRASSFGWALAFAMIGAFAGSILPAVFHMAAPWAVATNIAMSVLAAIAYMPTSGRPAI